MDTRKIESYLSQKYKYKKLNKPAILRFYKDNIPNFLNVNGDNIALYTCYGTKVCDKYDRIVIGDYGAFIEISEEFINKTDVVVPQRQMWRIDDERYSKNVKYIWMTIEDKSNIKIYKQLKTVSYADYKVDKYYVSVHDVINSQLIL